MFNSKGDDQSCVGTCNGETLPTNVEPTFYECWDDFKWECAFSHAGAEVKTDFTCHGAFTFFPGPHDAQAREHERIPGLAGMLDAGDNSTFAMITCEGNVMAITKASASMPDGVSGDKKTIMSIQGVGCSGMSKFIASRSPSRDEFYLSCEDVMISGSGIKTGKSADIENAEEELSMAASHFAHAFEEHASYSTWIDDTATTASPSLTAEQNPSATEAKQAGFAPSAQEETDQILGSQSMHIDAVDVWSLKSYKPGTCKATCNGGSLPLYGWWPCRGVTELKCSGEHFSASYDIHFECTGVSYPAFKICKGLTTKHITTSTDEAANEIMAVSKGKTHSLKVHEDGWKGSINVALGLSSLHTRSTAT